MGDYGYVLPTVFEDSPLQLNLPRHESTNRCNARSADCRDPRCVTHSNLQDISHGLRIPRISIENSYQDIDILKPVDNAILRNNLSSAKAFGSEWNDPRESSDADVDRNDRNGLRHPSLYLDVSDFDVDSAKNSSDNFPFQSAGLFTKRPLPEVPCNGGFEGSDFETRHWILRSKKVLITFIIVFFAFSTIVFGGLCMTSDSSSSSTTGTTVTVSSAATAVTTDAVSTAVSTDESTSTDGSTTVSASTGSSTTNTSTSSQTTDNYSTC